MSNNKRAWVTLATNDTYCLGALVLAHSLKNVSTKYDLVILITSNVTAPMRGALQSVFNHVKEVNVLDSGDAENLQLLARPELGVTFTKLHCWQLTQYDKCVFLDADTLVLQNCDDLFEREELSAAPDVGWPDCFNSGVFVFQPSEQTFKNIIDFALANGSFDGGDQGLLNMYFSSWATADSSRRLPFLYNLSSAAIYSYLPAFKWYGKGVKIIHFIGNSKPWLQSFNSVSRTVSTDAGSAHLTNFLQYWWNLFCSAVHPQLSPEMGGVAQSLSRMKLEERTPEQLAQEDSVRRQNWEQGNIDYMGRDSFDNIWSKISQTIGKVEPTATESSVSPVAETPSVPSESSEPVSTAVPEPRVAEVESVADQPAADKSTPTVTDEPPACPLPSKEQSKLASEPVSTTSQPAPVTPEAIPSPQETTVDSVTEPISGAVAPEPVLGSTPAETAPVSKATSAEAAEVSPKLAAAPSSPAETSPSTETLPPSQAAEISPTEMPVESAPTSQSPPESSSNEL